MSARNDRHVQIAIAGSGFGGIGMAARLQQRGFTDFALFERAGDVGGVWRDNTYPGCACDVQSHLYSFSFAPNPDWSRAYSPAQEIHQYLRGCVDRFGLGPHLKLRHEVKDSAWDDAAQVWRLQTSQGEYTADVLIAAVGALSEPSIPDLPGLQRFQGKVMHSARWDHSYDLAGKTVAVVGTGASAIQFVPAIQPKVAKLHLFQRTAPWVLPRNDKPIAQRRRSLYRRFPGAMRATRALIYVLRELTVIGFMYPAVMRVLERLARRYLKATVRDPELRRKLTPAYTMGCKRILISDEYLPSVTQPNVDLVTDGIREVREHSIVSSDGKERPIDALLFGTGFHVTDMPVAKHVRGRDGRTLEEHWQGSPKALAGTTVPGFPNFFMLQGPNTGLGHTSVITMIESQISHVLGALEYLRREDVAAVEPTPEAQAAFVRDVDQKLQGTVWNQGGCRSWYLDATGRNSTLWPGFTFTFKRRISRFNPKEYAAQERRQHRAVA